jgi:DNA-binding transcriptional regulator YdaS (Cro superfamily)
MNTPEARNNSIASAINALGGTQESAAKALNVSQAFISKLMNGKQKPSAKMALKIEQASNGEFKREQLRPDIFQ